VQCASIDRCRFTDDQNRSTFRDTHHLSHIGSAFEIREAMPLLTSSVPSLRGVTALANSVIK
jgi:hypothetical protein